MLFVSAINNGVSPVLLVALGVGREILDREFLGETRREMQSRPVSSRDFKYLEILEMSRGASPKSRLFSNLSHFSQEFLVSSRLAKMLSRPNCQKEKNLKY